MRAVGEVPEWLNGPVSKTGIRASVSWVRIPPSPPQSLGRQLNFLRVSEKFATFKDLRRHFALMRRERAGVYPQLARLFRHFLHPAICQSACTRVESEKRSGPIARQRDWFVKTDNSIARRYRLKAKSLRLAGTRKAERWRGKQYLPRYGLMQSSATAEESS